MGIFRQQRAIEALLHRTGELSTDVDDLKRANRSLELEFTELYDKVRHQMSRMAKRSAVERKENGADVGGELTPDDNLGTDPVSASILRRRGIRRQAE